MSEGASSFHEAIRMGSKVCHHLQKAIMERFDLDAAVFGNEGGFAPNIPNNKDGMFYSSAVSSLIPLLWV